jgi:hypothetical protein
VGSLGDHVKELVAVAQLHDDINTGGILKRFLELTHMLALGRLVSVNLRPQTIFPLF